MNRFRVSADFTGFTVGSVVTERDLPPGADVNRLVKLKCLEPLGKYTPPDLVNDPNVSREALIEEIGRLQRQNFGRVNDFDDDEYHVPEPGEVKRFAADDPGAKSFRVRSGDPFDWDKLKAVFGEFREAIREDLEELGTAEGDGPAAAAKRIAELEEEVKNLNNHRAEIEKRSAMAFADFTAMNEELAKTNEELVNKVAELSKPKMSEPPKAGGGKPK